MFAKETDKKPKIEPGLFFGVIICQATFIFPVPTVFVLHLVFLFTVCWKKRVLVGFACVLFKKGFIMGPPLDP